MAAYVIGQIEVTDPERYPEYTKLVPDSIAPYGGEFVVRGGEVTVLEGEPATRRTVVIRFPSRERAQAWWDSPKYRAAAELRRAYSEGRIILVDGVE